MVRRLSSPHSQSSPRALPPANASAICRPASARKSVHLVKAMSPHPLKGPIRRNYPAGYPQSRLPAMVRRARPSARRQGSAAQPSAPRCAVPPPGSPLQRPARLLGLVFPGLVFPLVPHLAPHRLVPSAMILVRCRYPRPAFFGKMWVAGTTGISSIAVSTILWKQTLAEGNVPDIEDESVPVRAVDRDRQPHGFALLIEGDAEDLDDLDSTIGWQVEERPSPQDSGS